jgi:hypothetical protein
MKNKNNLPESIRNQNPSKVNECREWFGTSAKRIEQAESNYSKQDIQKMMSDIKNKSK